MAYKKYNHQTFRVTLPNGNEYVFYCFSQGTRYGFRHGCDVLDWCLRPVVSVSCAYYNRTWERFQYESTLLKACRKLPQEDQPALRAWIQGIGDAEAEAAGVVVERFKEEFQKLPDSMKEAMRGMPLESVDDTRKAVAVAAMYNIITGK